jgi:predicted helicase
MPSQTNAILKESQVRPHGFSKMSDGSLSVFEEGVLPMEENPNFEAVLRKLESHPKGKGHAFEVAAKWWLQNDPNWASFFEPESIKLWNYSELADGPDIGIDLTARDFLGRNWAVQVKNWSPEKPLPKAEIDKFLTASNTKLFFGRVLLTTTKEISRNARKSLADQEKECIVVSYDALAKSDVWGAFLSQNESRAHKPKKITLFPHQREAVQAVKKGFTAGAMRAQLLMACGTGKTITAQKISEALNSRITVFLAPSLLLIQQSRTSWLNHLGAQSSPLALAICSDDTVAQDEVTASVLDLPFHVTTDVVEIESFLRLQGSKVIFSTYQSFASLEEGLQRSGVEPDLVIFDEAHKLAGSTSKKLSASLRSNALTNSRHLFMTATPRVFRSAKNTENQFEDQVFSMDDPQMFGEVLFDYSFGRAIEEKRLSRYEVVIMPVTDSETRSKIDNRTLLRFGEAELDAEMLAAHVGLAKAMELFSINKVISFHSSIQRARQFADFHAQLTSTLGAVHGRAPTSSTVLTGSDSVRKRKQVLDDLASTPSTQFKLVTNARCLTEGVDVPSLDGIAFIDPKTSQTDIVQAVGRAIRRGNANKEVGYIVLPVFVSQKSLELGEIESQRFSHVVSVLNALRSHDANLVVSFGKLRYALGRHGALTKLPMGVELCASEDIPADFFEKIQAYLVRSSSTSFEEYLGMLVSYVDIHGHAQIPSVNQTPEEERIYRWITDQRVAYRKGLLSEERISKLSEFEWWTWDPFEEAD